MGVRLVDQGSDDGGERSAGDDDRESLSQARRSIAGTRTRLEELAERLRELGLRLGGGPGDVPELGSPEGPPYDENGSRGPS